MKGLVGVTLGLAMWLAAPGHLFASEPVYAVIVGCVQGGVFMSESTDFGTHVAPGKYRITLFMEPGSPLDLTALEGRRIMASGHLLPGDSFFALEETLVDRGPCESGQTSGGLPKDWMPGDASREGVKFLDLMVDGMPLDFCLHWGRDCGKPAADARCQAQGYAGASTYEVRPASPPTRVFASGQICDVVFCDRIISVTCIGGKALDRPVGDDARGAQP